MVEKLVIIIFNELNKHNIEESCLLACYMFNQGIPDSEIVKGFLIRGEHYYLHVWVWIKYKNKIYDNANEQNMKYLPPPWYSVEEPYHLENVDDNYDEFYLGLQNFDTKTYYNMAPRNVENVLKLLKEDMQKSIISISENTFTYSHAYKCKYI